MAKRHPKNSAPKRSAASTTARPTTGAIGRLSRRKLWCFRVLAVVLAPALLFGLTELTLRLAGFGYPTHFLLPATHNGRDVLLPNNQFGWRFFGPQLARLPEPFAITMPKPPGTIRILVLGESAAKGEPQPAFGLPRMLQAMLALRHPGKRFEVINGAMTAINSHAIRLIARDCVAADADVWVLFLGNNEVVGPFGAGTVFGPQTPPLPLIRSALWVESTRTGQVLNALIARMHPGPEEPEEWRGMKMFLEQQVPADDPRMPSVYDHFTSNLADIIRAGRSRGAGIVLSTVAVNLRDCPPFGSAHPATLSETGRKRWDELYQLGIQAQARGDHEAALRQFAEAQAIDANHAELRYREGRSALALHQASTAREHFGAARDLDTLRFRCDSTLNAILRQFATNGILGTGVLVDAERAFADASPAGLPGKEMFYEHVHLTFPGNYLLARTIAAAVESQLPETALPGSTHASWPTEDECARRLGWSEWTRLAALQAILNRKRSAPFIAQADHEVELRELSAQVELLSVAQQSNGLAAGRRACALALAEAPDDAVLLGSLSVFEQLEGDSAAAFHSIQRQLDLVPGDPVAWQRLGLNLVGQRRFDEAATAFRRALELNPADPGPRLNLGQVLRQAGQREQAVTELRQAVKTRRNFALAWLTLGEVYGEMGNTAEADSCYQHALTGGPYRVTDLTVLARFCRSRGWNEAAVTNYNQAVVVSPHDAKLRVEFGQFLLALRRDQDAGEQLAEAVKLSPNAGPARHLYGLILGQQGLPAEAEVQLREAQRLAPDRLEATMDLGMALLAQGKSAEALAQFESVLQRNPTNALALRYAQKLRAQSGPPGP